MSIDARGRAVERHDQADERALARSAGAHQRRRRARRRIERDSLRTGTPSLYSNHTSSKRDVAAEVGERPARARPRRSRSRVCRHLADAIQAGEGFGDLRADGRDLDHRRRHEAGEEDVHDEVAERHPPVRGSRAPPTMIMITPMMPMMTVDSAVVAETPVIDEATLRNRRCTPSVKTICSRFSAV